MFNKWLHYEVALPVLLLLALWWPVGYLVINVPHLFQRIYASSDILALSALLVLGVSRELANERLNFGRYSRKAMHIRDGGSVLAILYFFIYGGFKVAYIGYKFPPAGQSVTLNITLIAVVSLLGGFMAISLAFYGKILIEGARQHSVGPTGR